MEHFAKFTLWAHLFGILALVNAIEMGHWWFFGAVFIFWGLLSIGVEVGIHRLFSHQAFTTKRWIEIALMYLGSIAGQGNIAFWVTIHKGYHHPKADTEEDPHSPIHGWFTSYIGWLFKKHPSEYSYRASIPLMRDPKQRFFQTYYYSIIYGTAVWLTAINPYLSGAYFMACVLCLHQNLLVNVLCHKGSIGYKNYEDRSNSHNLLWLSPFTWGLSLHNNHHHDPGSYSFTRKVYEIDPSSWVIRLIALTKREPRIE